MRIKHGFTVPFAGITLAAQCGAAQAHHILPAIEHGDIAVQLRAIATGLSAPDYATFAPGDSSPRASESSTMARAIRSFTLPPGFMCSHLT